MNQGASVTFFAGKSVQESCTCGNGSEETIQTSANREETLQKEQNALSKFNVYYEVLQNMLNSLHFQDKKQQNKVPYLLCSSVTPC